jgi:hypothetical protein
MAGASCAEGTGLPDVAPTYAGSPTPMDRANPSAAELVAGATPTPLTS